MLLCSKSVLLNEKILHSDYTLNEYNNPEKSYSNYIIFKKTNTQLLICWKYRWGKPQSSACKNNTKPLLAFFSLLNPQIRSRRLRSEEMRLIM
jgi:hypothetical protein